MGYVIDPPAIPSLEVVGQLDRFPVHRIYCVGRNYAAHAREMGHDPDREPPFFFCKPADALVAGGGAVPYPGRSNNLHHEVELVVAISKGGRDIPLDYAEEHVFGYAVGIDLTRRDLQAAAREKGQPWDSAKGFDASAPVSALTPAFVSGHLRGGTIALTVNGQTRQSADISELIWCVPEVIAELSTLFELRPGDLLFTGTPAGVAALQRGDRVEASVEGLQLLRVEIV
ncbi:fumarylacetoacetate hydrolase family protein [Proteobacteria bacterium 005FR1]|nr:fumarylacetoacetate hydrolase family protein [Proteobacteria bacterium 005FR1]